MNAQFTRHELIFKQASGTSRGVLTTKETYLLESFKKRTAALSFYYFWIRTSASEPRTWRRFVFSE